jgi:hypothetical protein
MLCCRRSTVARTTVGLPRAVRLKRGRGNWPLSIGTLPHLGLGVWITSQVLIYVAWSWFGADSPGRVAGWSAVPHRASTVYTVGVAYERDGRRRVVERTLRPKEFEAQKARWAQPEAAEDGRPVRVRHLWVGPLRHEQVLFENETPSRGAAGVLIPVLIWDALVAAIVYRVWVHPWRQKRLYRRGVMSPGRVTRTRLVSGKHPHYLVVYEFEADRGGIVSARIKVPRHAGETISRGDAVRVLHYPERTRPSVIYEHGDYVAAGVPETVEPAATAEEPALPPKETYTLRPRSRLVGWVVLPMLRLAGGALLLLAVTAWAGNLLVPLLPDDAIDDVELWIADVDSVAVDREGQIYVSAQYHRIQQYRPDGRFIRGWTVPTSGAFALHMNEHNQLQVATTRDDMLYTYGSDGTLLVSEPKQGAKYEQFARAQRDGARGPDGAIYRPRGRFFNPRVEKTDAAGATETVVAQPWHLTLFMAPFPLMPLGVAGFALLAGTKKWAKAPAGGGR